jgi:RNA ligase (TIGR02306 family)
MRKLAKIVKIDELNPIEGADAIECAVVGGWKVVAQKGLYNVGDLAVYFEIDSWIPHELAPFLSKGKEPREYEGVKGERLKTIKLRGQLSQGLLMPLVEINKFFEVTPHWSEDEDMTAVLNIKKWEKPMNAQLAGVCKGNFPSLIPKTDQERVQNLKKEIAGVIEAGVAFEITEKLEGSSMTCYLIDGVFGVCSRNMDLKPTAENAFWQTAVREDVEERMREEFGLADFAIQGELVGPGIQGNIYKLKETRFFVFDIYDIRRGVYVDPITRRSMVASMGLDHVPVLAYQAQLRNTIGIESVDDILAFAEGKSVLGDITGPEREGVVFKEINGGFTFKAISNKYLLGEK